MEQRVISATETKEIVRILERYSPDKVRPMDDIMFRRIAKKKRCIQEILRVILRDKELVVKSTCSQWKGANPMGRSVMLDCLCQLSSGKFIDIEVQLANKDDLLARAHYYDSIITVNKTPKGISSYKEVKETIIIFISIFSATGSEKMYSESMPAIVGENIFLRGLSRWIFININGRAQEGYEELAELVRLFDTNDYINKESFPEFSKVKRYYTNTGKNGGYYEMTGQYKSLLEEVLSEAEAKAQKETERRVKKATSEVTKEVTKSVSFNSKVETAINMYKGAGLPYEKTLSLNGVSEEDMPLYLKAIHSRLGA